MSELRKDPILGRWVIIATERGKRPIRFEGTEERKTTGFCPFCPGNEDKTPPEILAYGRPSSALPNSPGWTLRVVPNKYPALRVEGELDRRGEGIFDMMNGIGAHEVIIETPDHDRDPSNMDPERVRDIFRAYRERIIDLKRDIRLKYVLVFKNCKSAAGATLDHSHSQLIATPIIPKRVLEEMDGANKYYEYKERCVFCDMVRQEMETGKRLVLENNRFISIEPFAARFPFETWILPKEHIPFFEEMAENYYQDLADIFRETLRRINKALNSPPYNFIIHTTPISEGYVDYYHWHLELMPKLTRVAGFEWGSGFYINPTPPETAAEYLRGLAT